MKQLFIGTSLLALLAIAFGSIRNAYLADAAEFGANYYVRVYQGSTWLFTGEVQGARCMDGLRIRVTKKAQVGNLNLGQEVCVPINASFWFAVADTPNVCFVGDRAKHGMKSCPKMRGEEKWEIISK